MGFYLYSVHQMDGFHNYLIIWKIIQYTQE
nr:MAG TPA: hypothetical protein [Caudoviricetes sp.]